MLTSARTVVMLDTEFASGDKMSLHTAYSATGTNEVTGGTYAKQTITWAGASGRSKASSGNIDFPVPAATTVAWIGIWDTTAATFRGMWPNGGTDYSFQVDLTNNRIYCEGTGMVDTDRVVLTGSTLPTNITAGAHLYVVGTTPGDPDYFQVSLTSGGAAIDITSSQPSADARVSKVILETYSGAGTHRVSSFTIGL